MKRLVIGIIAVTALVSTTRPVMGQAKTVSSEMKEETGIVEAIDPAARTATIKKSDGTVVTIVARPDLKRFDEVKVGDKISARFYENVVVRVKRSDEPSVDTATRGTTGSEQVLPGGTKARQWTITATISAIDLDTPSITFTGPNGWKYSSKVQDASALAKVKVGDRVDIVWTEAVLVSLERGT